MIKKLSDQQFGSTDHGTSMIIVKTWEKLTTFIQLILTENQSKKYIELIADQMSVADPGFPSGGDGGAPISDTGAFRQKRTLFPLIIAPGAQTYF